ncbi:MAG: dTDP-4-dehydrorhamnose reductase [Oscillospiraceae bacterium]
MKILITGAAGQLGHELCRQLERGGSALGAIPERLQHAKVIAVDIEEADITSRTETAALIRHHAPDAVISCAAFTNVDAAEAERDTAFRVNALGPRNLAIACEEVGAKLLHLSTDYVFSGTGKEPYSETDLPAPASAYGTTKLLGEAYVRDFCSRWFVVRTSWLYGRTGANFVKTILKLAAEQPEVKVVHDQRGNPTNAEDVAHHLLQLVPTKEYGLYHCTGAGVCSWFEFAQQIVRLAGLKAKVIPCTTEEFPRPAPRPANSALEHRMLRATIGDHMRPWQDALAHYMKEREDA